MIISGQARHCKNCGSLDLRPTSYVGPTRKKVNVYVMGECIKCGHKAKYPMVNFNKHINDIYMVNLRNKHDNNT